MRLAAARASGIVLGLAASLVAACAGSPASPEPIEPQPLLTLTFGGGPFRLHAGTTYGLAVSADQPIWNVRCESSTGDAVTASYDMLDWDVYGWHAWFKPETLGEASLSCVADPNASGSVTVTVVRVAPVAAEYVRAYVPAIAEIDPTVGGSLHVHANFRESDGASEALWSCIVALEWDAATQTFRCGVASYQRVIVGDLSAVCVTDPAYRNPAYRGGAFYVNGTRLTTVWSGSKPEYQCMLFVIDATGSVVSPIR